MIEPPVVRVRVPASAPPPEREGFPWLPVLVPLALAGVMVAVTGSPVMLLLALAGPLLAAGGTLGARRHRRRAERRDAERRRAALGRAAQIAADAAGRERARLDAIAALGPRWGGPADGTVIAVARGPVASGVDLAGDDPEHTAGLPEDLLSAATLDRAPVLAEVGAGLWISGADVAAAAAARVLVLRLAAVAEPSGCLIVAPPSEPWVRDLPHASRVGTEREYRLRLGEREIAVRWGGRGEGTLRRVSAATADAATRPEAAAAARGLAERARSAARAGASEIPAVVDFAGLDSGARGDGLAAVIGRDAAGPVTLDLATQGPHAVVGGTTGSGKSEALVAWVAALARGRTPRAVSLVLLDFKGGAAFDRLRALPHVAGIVTDLDPRAAARALDALAGEVERRERELARAGVGDIAHLPPDTLPRLVVVVDEYAALVARHPEAPALVADLAARGRSLGIHLILGTQRPSVSIGDAVLANVALRLVLRVADARDSSALLGSDAASRIAPADRGRAVLGGSDSAPRLLQVALCTDADIAALAGDPSVPRAIPPWSPPLPEVVSREHLPAGAAASTFVFGACDEPRARAASAAGWEPRHGHLLVVAGPRAGASTALAALVAAAEDAGEVARWLPSDPAGLWEVLASGAALATPGVVVVDDLDAVLTDADPEFAVEFVDLVAQFARAAARRGVRVAASVRGLGGPMRSLAPVFGARLLLRLATREDHLLAGGDARRFDPRARPGSGEWESSVVQVARVPLEPRSRMEPAAAVLVRPDRELAVVATRPGAVAERWGAERCRPVDEGTRPDGARPVILGDPAAWQAEWGALLRARRELPVFFESCGVADVRAVLGSRILPPHPAPGEGWLFDGGVLRRAVMVAHRDGNRSETAV